MSHVLKQQESRSQNVFVVLQSFPVVSVCSWLPMELLELRLLPGWRKLWITTSSEVDK